MRASTWIPIFDVDNKLDFGTIPRKVTSFVMGIKNILADSFIINSHDSLSKFIK